MHSTILTDTDGTILHYNSVAKEIVFDGSEHEKGESLVNYMAVDSKERLRSLFHSEGDFKQPYFGQDFRLENREDCFNLRFYTNPDHGFDLLFLERPETSQEVLLSQEEYRWLERLKLTLFGISHELKTPLATAKGYVELLEDTEQEEIGELIANSLDRLKDILEDMTAPLAEMDENKKQVELGKTSELFSNMVSYMEPTKRFIGNYEVDFSYAHNKRVRLSKPRLYQVYNNLFENAMRATEKLGTEGKIEINARPCKKDHHFQCVVVDFSDNGVGMTEEVQEKVFTPYFTTRTPDSGTGLGGYLVNQFIVDAGGSVDVESELGEGTTFHIHLPYKKGKQS